MALDINALYQIIGESEPLLRVKTAMNWLLSPAAEGIGEQLLKGAYEAHAEPLTILATTEEDNGYVAEIHTVRINPAQIDNISIIGPDGTSQVMSVERCLAHELEHSAQSGVLEGRAKVNQVEAELHAAYNAQFTPEELMAQNMHIVSAMEASDYPAAISHIEAYVDQYGLPMYEALNPQLYAHPVHQRFTQEFEVPAVKTENRVAVLRGEPIRSDYITAHQVTPAKFRQMLID